MTKNISHRYLKDFFLYFNSFITAVELLGNPTEIYEYGTQYWLICISFICVIPLTSKLYLPVFMKLRLTSSYEYFQLRFSPPVRYLASGLYIFQMILYTSVAVYAPALALSHGKIPKKKTQRGT